MTYLAFPDWSADKHLTMAQALRYAASKCPEPECVVKLRTIARMHQIEAEKKAVAA